MYLCVNGEVYNHLGIMTTQIWSDTDGHVLHVLIYLLAQYVCVCVCREAGVRITCVYQNALNICADSLYISLKGFAPTLQ